MNKDIIYKLAQKDYNKKILDSAHNELNVINKYLSHDSTYVENAIHKISLSI